MLLVIQLSGKFRPLNCVISFCVVNGSIRDETLCFMVLLKHLLVASRNRETLVALLCAITFNPY